MKVWSDHDRDTDYAPVTRILGGLGPEQAGRMVAGLPHSLYQELWHAATWQRLTLGRDAAALARWNDHSKFPAAPAPASAAAWTDLVADFLADLQRGEVLAADTAALDRPYFDGFTARETLESLAVHNAYHLARIVALRQLLGAWEA